MCTVIMTSHPKTRNNRISREITKSPDHPPRVTMVTRWGKFGRVFCKQTNVAACRFQNECNKVVIAFRVVQFWSEIKLVITNRTPASRSCDFVITRLISDQIALHSVQLPLFISYFMFCPVKYSLFNSKLSRREEIPQTAQHIWVSVI